jgi:hypothetical protein
MLWLATAFMAGSRIIAAAALRIHWRGQAPGVT